MDVQQQQLASTEQEVVLRCLAAAAARRGCRFLEVGSWCGQSSVILAKVAQQQGGQLFCVDWWKGTPGTDLADIAAREDIFALFWQRICDEGLQDVVVPIRGRADLVARVLQAQSFDFVFLDGDHGYRHVRRDIRDYAPLVRRGGILCGHDCEGRIDDYDAEFLHAGLSVDFHETVHCGVVRAVGEAFRDFSLNHSVWSVRAAGAFGGWKPTNLTFPEIVDKRQAPPALGATKSHNLLRYGNRVYAAPYFWPDFDVTNPAHRNHAGVISAPTRAETERLACRDTIVPSQVVLVEEAYLGFNIVAFAGRYFAAAQEAGVLDFPTLPAYLIAELQRRSQLFCASSHQEARLLVALHVLESSDRPDVDGRPDTKRERSPVYV